MKDCLKQAASQGHTSIAFPALGTGNLGYPEQNVAKSMIDTVISYAEKTSSSIQDVKIVIFHLDQKTQQVINPIRKQVEFWPHMIDIEFTAMRLV